MDRFETQQFERKRLENISFLFEILQLQSLGYFLGKGKSNWR